MQPEQEPVTDPVTTTKGRKRTINLKENDCLISPMPEEKKQVYALIARVSVSASSLDQAIKKVIDQIDEHPDMVACSVKEKAD